MTINRLKKNNLIKKRAVSTLILCTALSLAMSLFAGPAFASDELAEIESATRQDPKTIVLVLSSDSPCRIYRAETVDGEYSLLGSSDGGAYIDATAAYPNEYYYRTGNDDGPVSAPVKSGYNAHSLSRVMVFMYHHFIPEEDFASETLSQDFKDYAVSESEFEADLIFLTENGYHPITSNELLQYLNGEAALPPKAVIISIDDGSLSVYRYAFPLLQKYNVKAELNVIGDQIDSATDPFLGDNPAADTRTPENYCTWYEINTMRKSGLVSIASHSYRLHYYSNSRLPGWSGVLPPAEVTEAEYAAEVAEDYRLENSCIEGWTGKSPITLAYPYSKRSAMTDRILLQSGYKILMAGELKSSRNACANYFVDGAPASGYSRLLSRTARMTGTALSQYISDMLAYDKANGVNGESLYFSAARELDSGNQPCVRITAKKYSDGSMPALALVAEYDENGKMLSQAMTELQLNPWVAASASITLNSGDENVKCFLLDKESLLPLTECIILNSSAGND